MEGLAIQFAAAADEVGHPHMALPAGAAFQVVKAVEPFGRKTAAVVPHAGVEQRRALLPFQQTGGEQDLQRPVLPEGVLDTVFHQGEQRHRRDSFFTQFGFHLDAALDGVGHVH